MPPLSDDKQQSAPAPALHGKQQRAQRLAAALPDEFSISLNRITGVTDRTTFRGLIPIVCVLGALPFLLGACGTENGGTTGGNSSQTFSPSAGDGAHDSPSEDSPTFENGVLTTPDLKIRITRYKVIKPGKKGNEYGKKPVIAFWYRTTNRSGAKVDPTDFLFNFTAYQDNNPNAENKLEVGSLPDERFGDSQLESIKKGGTVENAVAYELDDLVTPVDLVATDGLVGEDIGKATYNLN